MHVPKAFSLWGFSIALYGVILAIAITTAILLCRKLAPQFTFDPDEIFDYALGLLVTAILGARCYYVLFSWSYYRDHLAEIFNLRAGGLAIYGGILGGMFYSLFWSRRHHRSLLTLLDLAAIGTAWGQMLGRWGNFFNREAFGQYTDSLFAMQLPLDAVSAANTTQEMLDHSQIIDGITYIQVHPVFLYESLLDLSILLILLFLLKTCRKRYTGLLLGIYLLLYGIGRFLLEGLRTDQLLLPGTSFPVSQGVSLVLILAAGILLIYGHLSKK